MASEKTTVTFQIERSKKDRWEQWLENKQSRYDDNLSQFIRLAVENLINETENGSPTTDASASVEGGNIGQIEDRLTDIDNRMRELATAMENIETSNRSNYVVDQLQQDVYDALPSVDMSNIDIEHTRMTPEEYGKIVDEIKDEVGADAYLIEQTLDQLHQNTNRIVQIGNDGATYYWRDE